MKTFILIFFTFFFASTAHSQTVTVDKNPKNSFTSSTLYNDDIQTVWGTGSDFACEYDTAQTPDAMVCGTSSDSNNFILTEKADIGTDFALPASSDPTLYIHSNDESQPDEWVSIFFDSGLSQGIFQLGGEDTYTFSFEDSVQFYGALLDVGPDVRFYATQGPADITGDLNYIDSNRSTSGASADGLGLIELTHIFTGSGTQSGYRRGGYFNIRDTGSVVQSGTGTSAMVGGYFLTENNSTGVSAEVMAVKADALASLSGSSVVVGTITDQSGIKIQTGYASGSSGTGTITTSKAVAVQSPSTTSAGRTITDYYGLKIENAEATGVTNAYSIATGTGRVQFGGNVEFSNGKAMTASLYQIGRDADGTNQLHFNVPTGASMEWSVNDVAVMTLTGSNMSMNNQPIQNIGNSGTDFGGSGQLTVGNAATSGGTTALTVVMGAHTAVSTNTPAISLTAYTNTLNSGSSLANSSGVELQAPTYNGVAGGAAETITDAATFRVVGPAVAGSNITVTNAYAMLIDAGDSRFDGFIISNPQTVSIADNGGGTPAASTVTPSSNVIQITCNDANGCDITMSETGQKNGTTIRLVNVSANTINFADTSGVTEIAGAYAAGQYDSIVMTYQSNRWIEDGRSNN